MAKVYLFGGHFNRESTFVANGVLRNCVLDMHCPVDVEPIGISDLDKRCYFADLKTERYYLNEMCFDCFDLNLRAIETTFFIVGSTERSELDQINQKLIRYANRGVNFTASRVRVV